MDSTNKIVAYECFGLQKRSIQLASKLKHSWRLKLESWLCECWWVWRFRQILQSWKESPVHWSETALSHQIRLIQSPVPHEWLKLGGMNDRKLCSMSYGDIYHHIYYLKCCSRLQEGKSVTIHRIIRENFPIHFYGKSQPEDVFLIPQRSPFPHSALPPKSCLHPTIAANLNDSTAGTLPVYYMASL